MSDMMIRRSHPLTPSSSRSWGTIEEDSGRYGARHVRLQIFPPDITPRERRLWRWLHLWPAVGFVLAVAVGAVIVPLAGVETAVPLALASWIVPLVALWLLAGPLTARIHELWTSDRRDGSHDAVWSRFDALATSLADADRSLAAGEIDAAAHRERWRAAYAAARGVAIASERRVATPARENARTAPR